MVGLAGDPSKSVFRGECAPGPVSPAHCEVQHVRAEIATGQAGQLRFWTADRYMPFKYLNCHAVTPVGIDEHHTAL